MDRVMGRWPKIYWTGQGSTISGFHTKKEFVKRARDAISEHLYYRIRGDPPGVPQGKVKRNDVEGWIRILGARWIPTNNIDL